MTREKSPIVRQRHDVSVRGNESSTLPGKKKDSDYPSGSAVAEFARRRRRAKGEGKNTPRCRKFFRSAEKGGPVSGTEANCRHHGEREMADRCGAARPLAAITTKKSRRVPGRPRPSRGVGRFTTFMEDEYRRSPPSNLLPRHLDTIRRRTPGGIFTIFP